MSLLAIGALGAAGLAALLLLDRTLLRRDVPWLIVLAIAIAREVVDPLPAVVVGSIAINGEDVVLGLSLLVVLGWLVRGAALQAPQVLVAGALVLVWFSIFRGAFDHGLPAAVNEARETMYFLGAALLGSFAPVDREARQRLHRWWLITAGALVALAVVRWGIVLAGLPFLGEGWYEPEYGGLRVLASNGAVVITLGALLLLPRVLRGIASRVELGLLCLYGATVVVLQHRSVWAVLLIGTAVVVWQTRGDLDRWLVATVGIAGVAAVLVTVALLDPQQLVAQAQRADAASDQTWEWRVSGWVDLIGSSGPDGPLEVLIGEPYGEGWTRSVSAGYDVDVPPHNFYPEMGLRIGLLGLGLVLVAGVQSARRLRRHDLPDDGGFLNATALLGVLVVQAVYSVPYNLGMEQGLLFGLAIAVWAEPRRAEGFGVVVIPPPDRHQPVRR